MRTTVFDCTTYPSENKRSWCLLLLFLLTTVYSLTCRATPDSTQLGFAVGDRLNHKLRSWTILPASWSQKNWQLDWQLAVDSWQPHNAHGRGLQAVSLRAILQRRLSVTGAPLIEVGTGPLYLTRTRSLNNLNWGTHLQFDTHLGITKEFGEERKFTIRYSLHHASNAGLDDTNPGVNFQMLQMACRL